MLNKLMDEYEDKFEDITLVLFLNLDDNEQVKILRQCLKNNERIYENKYFIDHYMEKAI